MFWDQADCKLFSLMLKKILLGKDLDKKETARKKKIFRM